MRLRITTPSTVLFGFLLSISSSAQWLNEPDPRLPRIQDGKPILTAKAPRTPDGKPDLTGLWIRREGESAPKDSNELAFSLSWFMPKNAEIPLRPTAAAVFKERATRDGGCRTSEHCLPSGVPGAMLPPSPFKIVQMPGPTLILYETWVDFRQIRPDRIRLREREGRGPCGG
jgi:hypothetical protein